MILFPNEVTYPYEDHKYYDNCLIYSGYISLLRVYCLRCRFRNCLLRVRIADPN